MCMHFLLESDWFLARKNTVKYHEIQRTFASLNANNFQQLLFLRQRLSTISSKFNQIDMTSITRITKC